MGRQSIETIAEYLTRNDWVKQDNKLWLYLGNTPCTAVEENVAYMFQQLKDLKSEVLGIQRTINSVLGD